MTGILLLFLFRTCVPICSSVPFYAYTNTPTNLRMLTCVSHAVLQFTVCLFCTRPYQLAKKRNRKYVYDISRRPHRRLPTLSIMAPLSVVSEWSRGAVFVAAKNNFYERTRHPIVDPLTSTSARTHKHASTHATAKIYACHRDLLSWDLHFDFG